MEPIESKVNTGNAPVTFRLSDFRKRRQKIKGRGLLKVTGKTKADATAAGVGVEPASKQ